MTDRNGISIDKSEPPSRSVVAVRWVRLVAAVVIVALLVAFIVDNSEHVRVGFVFAHARVRLIWVLLITAALGALAGRLVPRLRASRGRRRPDR
ncbi:MAG TPA: LapA family protein [Acidimicrobiales bacterium]